MSAHKQIPGQSRRRECCTHQTAVQIYCSEIASQMRTDNYTQHEEHAPFANRATAHLLTCACTNFAAMPYFDPDDCRPFLAVTGVDEDAVFCCLLLAGL